MMKKITSVVLALLVLVSFSFADATAVPVEGVVKPTVYTLESALQVLLKDNLTIKLGELAVKTARIGNADAVRAMNKMGDLEDLVGGDFSTSANTLYVSKGIYVKSTELAVDSSIKTLAIKTDALKIELRSNFYGILSAEESLKINEDSAKRLNELYTISEKKYKLGLISLNALNAAKVDYDDALLKIDIAKRALDYKKMQFNQTMNLPLNTPVVLQGTLVYKPSGTIDLEAKVKTALNSRLDVYAAKQLKDIEGLYLAVDKSFYGESSYAAMNRSLAYEEKNFNYAKESVEAELAVRKAYHGLLDAEQTYLNLKKSVSLAKEGYEIAKTMYTVGLNTQNDVSKALIQYNSAENGLNSALLGYVLSEMAFEASYTTGM